MPGLTGTAPAGGFEIFSRELYNMTQRIQTLEARLRVLEQQIKEMQARMPAHSVKPPMMMELIELEDEYEGILKELAGLKAAVKK